jgi:hypothetical protein
MSELKKCPICHEQAKIGYACGDYFAHCSDGCPSPMCDHPNENTTACSWNDWAKWYEKNRRAQPENARQHALQTGVCPMCEDCPDGCPVEAPNDSRNQPENEPNTLSELRGMGGEPVWTVTNCVEGSGRWEILGIDTYGDTWLAYRRKPERSDAE